MLLSYSILSTQLELIPEKLLNFRTPLQLNGCFRGSLLSTKCKYFPNFVKYISLMSHVFLVTILNTARLFQMHHIYVLFENMGIKGDILSFCPSMRKECQRSKGSPSIPKWMIFWKISERPLTPPPFFGNFFLQFFQKFMTTSTEFATKFFGSEMTPPLFQSFSGNS